MKIKTFDVDKYVKIKGKKFFIQRVSNLKLNISDNLESYYWRCLWKIQKE